MKEGFDGAIDLTRLRKGVIKSSDRRSNHSHMLTCVDSLRASHSGQLLATTGGSWGLAVARCFCYA